MPNKHASPDDPFKGIKSGRWTKYGGSESGLLRSQRFNAYLDPTWFCQCCREENPMSLPGFMIRDEQSGEFAKICSKCFFQARQVNYSYRYIRMNVLANHRD